MMPRRELPDELLGNIVGMQFAVHLLFPHAARDQLRVLGAEIEDEDLLVGHGCLAQTRKAASEGRLSWVNRNHST
jgi:hypothetical protein